MSAAAFISAPSPAPGWPTLHLMYRTICAKTSGRVENNCILQIICLTHGAPRKPGEPPPEWTAPIAAKEFAECAAASDRGVEFALAHALEVGLIERKRAGKVYAYRVRPDLWESAPAYSPTRAIKGEEKANAERTAVRRCAPIILKPGARSKPINLSQLTENATDMQYEVAKDLPALSIQSTVEAGNLVLSIRNAISASFETPASPPAAEDLTKIRGMLNAMFRKKMGPIDDAICRKALQLRGHATIEDIAAKLWMRTKDKQYVTPKLILMIVQDCANAAAQVEEGEAKLRAQIEAERRYENNQDAKQLADAYANGDEEHRAWMRTTLEYQPE